MYKCSNSRTSLRYTPYTYIHNWTIIHTYEHLCEHKPLDAYVPTIIYTYSMPAWPVFYLWLRKASPNVTYVTFSWTLEDVTYAYMYSPLHPPECLPVTAQTNFHTFVCLQNTEAKIWKLKHLALSLLHSIKCMQQSLGSFAGGTVQVDMLRSPKCESLNMVN